jgi:serine phosphatase RsbU (regulator of sigma subunit)
VLAVAPGGHLTQLREAAHRKPDLLVIDRLDRETTVPALEAADEGLRVLSQLDTAFYGAGVARQLLDMGASRAQLRNLAWVLSVQRLPTLCPYCKQVEQPDPALLERLRARSEIRALLEREGIVEGAFSRSVGCANCNSTGRLGDISAYDVFRAAQGEDPCELHSLLPLETYLFRLAALDYLPLEDLLDFETRRFHRTFNLLVDQEETLGKISLALEGKLAELEAANRVLDQRSRSLISLQTVSQTLIGTDDLERLAAQVCRQAQELCGADRAVLYFLRPDDKVEVLATQGWDPERFAKNLRREGVFTMDSGGEPAPYHRWPPGIPPRHPDVEGAELRAGLYAPLIAQHEVVGLMVVHSTRKKAFLPGETALLNTLANQAAVALQRAGLIEQLRGKITELEAAQAELVKKERLEREMELARQVQLKLLPDRFPTLPGYDIAARYEPARRVGGDFYDVIPLEDGRFVLTIADVSDKGMPAALYMALTRSLLFAEARRKRSPAAVLASVNELLLALGEPEMFVTAFYGVVDSQVHRLTYACAGHDHPVLLHGQNSRFLDGEGIPLGVFGGEGFRLSEQETDLLPGDRLVLFTDGLADVVAPDGQLFDSQRLKGLFEAHAGLPSAEFCQAVFADLLAYQGSAEQFDDMAMLVVGAL